MIYFNLLFVLLVKDVTNLLGFIKNIKCHNRIIQHFDKSSYEVVLPYESDNDDFAGYDLTNSKYDNTTIERITELHYKKKILDKLIDNNIGINDKLKFIEYYDLFPNKYTINVSAGGLFNDWNYTIPDEIL